MHRWGPRSMRDGVDYWLKDQPVQNFGDSLTELLLERCFVDLGARSTPVRIIGSCLDDSVLDDELSPELRTWGPAYDERGDRREPRLIAWGLGLRRRGGLSEDRLAATQVLAVRGPLTRDELGLDASVPIGDPALLLPYVYQPRPDGATSDRTVCVPHFHDDRDVEELLTISGADIVLRPQVAPGVADLERWIDAIVSARFVLTASLHGAIVAVAYGRPFAFWDPGVVDLPFKWEDFAASVGAPCRFVSTVAEGLRCYEDELAESVAVPSRLELLLHAPFLVRPELLANVAGDELGWDRDAVLAVLRRSNERAREILDDVRAQSDAAGAHESDLAERLSAAEASLVLLGRDLADALRVGQERLDAWDEANRTIAAQIAHVSAVEAHAGRLQEALDAVHRDRKEWERIHAELLAHADALQRELDVVRSRRVWRWTARLRRGGAA